MKTTKKAACVLIINPESRKIVLTTRRNSAQVGLPGGKSDDGEWEVDTAIRETFEETGIQLDFYKLKFLYSAVCHGDVDYETICFIYTYSGKIPGGQEEGIQAYWGEIGELLTNSPFEKYNRDMIIWGLLSACHLI